MRKEQSLVFDDRDEEMAAILVDLGLSRHVARSLVFMAQVDEAVSAHVEQGAGLRQPEVSVAMQFLREREWVTKRDLRREGKGRPVHCYRLVRSVNEVIATLEKEKREEAERNARLLSRLRDLASQAVAGAPVRP